MTQVPHSAGERSSGSGLAPRLVSAAGTAALLVLVLLAFAPTLRFDFVWDDHEQVVDNPLLESWESLPLFFQDDVLSLSRAGAARSNYYRPLFYAQYLAMAQAFGINATAWHAVALLLHLLAVLTVRWFLRRLGLPAGAAWAAAALFAVHPAQGETVAWVAAAYNGPPAAALTLLALGAHIRWSTRRAPGALILSAIGFAAALLVKESSLSFLLLAPVVDELLSATDRTPARSWRDRATSYLPAGFAVLSWLAIATYWGDARPLVLLAMALPVGALLGFSAYRLRRTQKPLWPAYTAQAVYALTVIGYFVARRWAVGPVLGAYPDAQPFEPVLATQPTLVLFYLRLALWPWGYSPSYALRYSSGFADPLALAALGALVAVTVALVLVARRRPWVTFATLWFAASLLPALNTLSFRETYLVHQRYLYLALVAPLALLARWLFARWSSVAIRTAVLAPLLGLGVASLWLHNEHWRSDTALWQRVAAVDPGNPAAFDWLGSQALDRDRVDEAEALFRQAIAADPEAPQGHRNLAVVLHTRRGQPQAALPHYETALDAFDRLAPRYAEEHLSCRVNHATALAQTGKVARALPLLVRLADEPPFVADAARNAAVLLRQAGRTGDARAVLERAVRHHPSHPTLAAMLQDLERLALRDAPAVETQP